MSVGAVTASAVASVAFNELTEIAPTERLLIPILPSFNVKVMLLFCKPSTVPLRTIVHVFSVCAMDSIAVPRSMFAMLPIAAITASTSSTIVLSNALLLSRVNISSAELLLASSFENVPMKSFNPEMLVATFIPFSST